MNLETPSTCNVVQARHVRVRKCFVKTFSLFFSFSFFPPPIIPSTPNLAVKWCARGVNRFSDFRPSSTGVI